MKKPRIEFPRGTVVMTTRTITDVDCQGQPYIHAVQGSYGVVLDDDAYHVFPNVKWGPCGEGGVCNVPAEFLVKISYWQAVDFPTQPVPKEYEPKKYEPEKRRRK